MTMEEIWRPINGYQGLYQVSDQGKVRSLKFGKERIMKNIRNKDGYLRIGLRKNGEHKLYLVHRLVAQTFIQNPQNLPEVNHKDENKDNNSVQNLEWCSSKYNANFGTRNQRQAEKLSKPILQYTKYGAFVREWKSATDVQRNIGFFCQNISSCCNGKCKSAYNFIWKFKD